jgi:PleD family two-component response regulator
VARRLRSNRRTKDVPIIFLTEKRGRKDRLHGLELGADDYITKPFDVQELRLRVRNALRRAAPSALTNPVTSLPEGPLVDERLGECLELTDWAVLHVSIANLDAFREAYGFVASDDVLRAISLMIQNAVRDLGSPRDFLGQFGPTELVLVTSNGCAGALAERIQSRLSQSIDYFYPLKDAEKAAVGGKHLAVHLAQVSSSQGPFASVNALKEKLHPVAR